MSFKGGTVALLVGAAMLTGGALTFTVMDLSISAIGGQGAATSTRFTSSELQKLNLALAVIENKYVTSIERNKIVNGAIKGMMATLDDPHSSYMGKEEAEQFNQNIEGAFTGIGVEVTMENGKVTIISPIKGSPADRAGMKPKDVLISVNGESLEGKSLHEAVAKIRGSKGTKAKIVIKRAGLSAPFELVVVRNKIDRETVYPKMLDGSIGYIEIRQFSLNTFDRFKEELEKLEKQGMKGLVIDVRNNPGGMLDIVQKMAELFLPEGKPIFQMENRNKERNSTLSKGGTKLKPYPVTMLTNKGSASASEIMASALKEMAGVKLVGEHTFGKGTVQAAYNFSDGSLVKMTISKWLTPQGNWIHHKGIEPDIVVQQPDFYYVAPVVGDKTLVFDMNDEHVKNVQIMLNGLGYKPGRKDGYFSKDTEAAVKAFQRDQELTVSGKVDVKTGEKLVQAIIKVIRDTKNDTQLHKAVDVLKKEIR